MLYQDKVNNCIAAAIYLVGLSLSATQHSEAGQHKHQCDECKWKSPVSGFYDLSLLCDMDHDALMDNPRNAHLKFGVCRTVPCKDGAYSAACIHVPGAPATSTGNKWEFSAIEENLPGAGIRLTITHGDLCQITGRPRITIIDFQCIQYDAQPTSHLIPSKAFEGTGSDICTYYLIYQTSKACPTKKFKYSRLSPVITAVSGCVDSVPTLSTSDCSTRIGTLLTIHGFGFSAPGFEPHGVEITINNHTCTEAQIVNGWTMTCNLPAGSGQNHTISATFILSSSYKKGTGETHANTVEKITVQSTTATVTYRPLVDYHHHFSSFMELGVGGLGPQIYELYQRAFASRSIPSNILDQLGIEHAKGILLHGPPGSGKTLLARTIAKILKTEKVRLVNAPEVMSKYLGESEKNLRSHFAEAEKAWLELGDASDLFIIIIDEIDAICKQRGKSDTSAAAAAYDSVVNQLLTNMDGLSSAHNFLVIGMTNRPELIDPALLRPGRFEIQIEIGLPDEQGRWEIFYIHTQSMRDNGYLTDDVDLHHYAKVTSQYSGAEIAGVIRLAASYALDRKYSSQAASEDLKITAQDFDTALEHFKPSHTHKGVEILRQYLPQGYIPCGQQFTDIIEEVVQMGKLMEKLQHGQLETVLLHGPRGTGKSGLAAYLSSQLNFTFVKVVRPTDMLRLGESARSETLIDTFQDAYKAAFGVLVLDDLDLLAEVGEVGGKVRVSHDILHTLLTLLTARPPKGSKLLVIGTVSIDTGLHTSAISQVGLVKIFTHHYEVPPLKHDGIITVLKHMGFPLNEDLASLHLTLTSLFKVTDCVDVHLAEKSKTRDEASQMIFQQCLSIYKLLKL